MDDEKKNKVVTQILYKKYSNLFGWLLFNDLYRLIKATNVYAKHDENYMPASIQKKLQDNNQWKKNYK